LESFRHLFQIVQQLTTYKVNKVVFKLYSNSWEYCGAFSYSASTSFYSWL